MAIEIIKRGQVPEEKLYKGTCYRCKTEFRCQQKDGTYHAGDQRDGEYVTVTCPLCKTRAYAYPMAGGQLIPSGARSSLASQYDSAGNIQDR